MARSSTSWESILCSAGPTSWRLPNGDFFAPANRCVAGVGAVALFVAVLTGLAPVQFGDDLISGPTGGLVFVRTAVKGKPGGAA